MAWLDMHLHSNYSDDGQYSPRELIAICSREGVRAAAIADHNTVRGIAEGKEYAKLSGITLIPAIELDCVFQGVNLHLLGYWINETYDEFTQVEKSILLQEQQAARKRLELVAALGIHINADDILQTAKDGVVSGEMIAEAALADPQNEDNPLLLPYRAGGARGDNPFVNFYWDYCAQGKPAYVPIKYIALADAVNLVRQAGGIPILAHPGNNISENAELLQGILHEGVVGIEAFSSYHTPKQVAFYRQKASEFGVLTTCGSDFHGKTKPSIQIGSVDCGGLEEEIFAELTKRMAKK